MDAACIVGVGAVAVSTARRKKAATATGPPRIAARKEAGPGPGPGPVATVERARNLPISCGTAGARCATTTLAHLEMLSLALWALTSRHTNPLSLPLPYQVRDYRVPRPSVRKRVEEVDFEEIRLKRMGLVNPLSAYSVVARSQVRPLARLEMPPPAS